MVRHRIKFCFARLPQNCGAAESNTHYQSCYVRFFAAGATLVKHRDPYAGSLRYHLGLECPGHSDCAIYVDGEPYVWRNGEDVIFDETFIHYAQNKTEHQRIVLFCDLERPLWFCPRPGLIAPLGALF